MIANVIPRCSTPRSKLPQDVLDDLRVVYQLHFAHLVLKLGCHEFHRDTAADQLPRLVGSSMTCLILSRHYGVGMGTRFFPSCPKSSASSARARDTWRGLHAARRSECMAGHSVSNQLLIFSAISLRRCSRKSS